jgi:hypothetical protein
MLSKGVLDRLGFTCRVAPSGVGPSAGDGLFVRGEVNPGEIVAWYPGLVYALENVRHIPGFPKVAKSNSYLIARYDGSVVDAKPWGVGGGLVDVDSESKETMSMFDRSKTTDEDGENDGETTTSDDDARASSSFGSWPGPPLAGDDETEDSAKPLLKKTTRAGMGGFLDDALEPELDSGLRSQYVSAALDLQRDNPLALAHFANHPPRGCRPNVVVAGVDVTFRGGQIKSLRRFLPNVGVGAWPEPATREEANARKLERDERGWFASRLLDAFGEEDVSEEGARLLKKNAASEAASESGDEDALVVVPTLVLVAAEALRDEEVFLNYRLSTHVDRPEWYHPVDAEEDKRRWASE